MLIATDYSVNSGSTSQTLQLTELLKLSCISPFVLERKKKKRSVELGL